MSEQPRSATPDWRVDVVGPEAFAESIPVTATIYGEAMRRQPELVVQRREIMGSHVHRAGFVGVLARDANDAVIAFGYGYHGRPGDWWHDVVARALGQQVGRRDAREWLHDLLAGCARVPRRLLRGRRAACPPQPSRRRHRPSGVGVRAVACAGRDGSALHA